jgi:HPt (histidine-containing phosphotransfer) domain-containing protein
MTAKECYDAMGGDYSEILGRMGNDERVIRFLGKFLNDPSYEQLCVAMEIKNIPDAFRAAHTLKGVCKNLAITKLADSSSVLADLLRNRETYGEDIDPAFESVCQDYLQVKDCISTLLGE